MIQCWWFLPLSVEIVGTTQTKWPAKSPSIATGLREALAYLKEVPQTASPETVSDAHSVRSSKFFHRIRLSLFHRGTSPDVVLQPAQNDFPSLQFAESPKLKNPKCKEVPSAMA